MASSFSYQFLVNNMSISGQLGKFYLYRRAKKAGLCAGNYSLLEQLYNKCLSHCVYFICIIQFIKCQMFYLVTPASPSLWLVHFLAVDAFWEPQGRSLQCIPYPPPTSRQRLCTFCTLRPNSATL
jgi:hypothetical protein